MLGLPVEEGLVEAYKVSVLGCLHREVHTLDGCDCGSRSGDGCFSPQLFDQILYKSRVTGVTALPDSLIYSKPPWLLPIYLNTSLQCLCWCYTLSNFPLSFGPCIWVKVCATIPSHVQQSHWLAPVYEFYTTCCHVVVYLIAGTWDRMNALHYTPCLPSSSGFPSSPFIGPPSPPGFPVSSFSLPAMFDHSGSWDNPDLRWVEQQQQYKSQVCFL